MLSQEYSVLLLSTRGSNTAEEKLRLFELPNHCRTIEYYQVSETNGWEVVENLTIYVMSKFCNQTGRHFLSEVR